MSYGYDHQFEGQQGQPCQADVPRFNRDWDHDFVDKWVEVYERDAEGYPSHGRVDPAAGCQYDYAEAGKCKEPREAEKHQRRVYKACGASWTSALHPPDQFRHWCSALEAGADCMHFED